MRKNRKVCVRFIWICPMSLRHPLSLSLLSSLWSVRQSVSPGRSHYCRWSSRILQGSVAGNVRGRIPDRRPAGGEGGLVSSIFPSLRPPHNSATLPAHAVICAGVDVLRGCGGGPRVAYSSFTTVSTRYQSLLAAQSLPHMADLLITASDT